MSDLAGIATLWFGYGLGFATAVVICFGIARRWSWLVTPAPDEQGPHERAYRRGRKPWVEHIKPSPIAWTYRHQPDDDSMADELITISAITAQQPAKNCIVRPPPPERRDP